MGKGCLSALLLALAAGPLMGQTAQGTWFRQGIYQLERLQVDAKTLSVYRYDHLKLSDDSLTVALPENSADRSSMRILRADTLSETTGSYIVRPDPDSAAVSVLYHQVFYPGLIGFLPHPATYRSWEEAVARAGQSPESYLWLQSRMYVSDSLAEALPNRPSLMDVSRRDVIRVLKKYQAYRSDVEHILGKPGDRPPSLFAVRQMLRQLVFRLFLEEGYNPYAAFSIHPFSRFADDPAIKSLLSESPESVLPGD